MFLSGGGVLIKKYRNSLTWGALLLLLLTTGCGTTTAQKSPTSQTWLSVNKAQRSVILTLVANYDSSNGGMNFDGYSKGQMVVDVPQGWKVTVHFSNANGQMTHSAMVVPFSAHSDMNFSNSSVAFAGATSPNPSLGTAKGVNQDVTFTVDTSGQYAIVCAVPSHAAMGMWDTLNVIDSTSSPSIKTS
jgi:plastocyanin